ncbi:MAG: divalent-cation tolerance protein CutA [candidate division WOR-3 bacterium]
MKVFVVLCTIPPDKAEALAKSLVENHLAACVNIIPSVKSFYRWEGNLCEDTEALLVIKTTEEAFPALLEFTKANHPYSVPEIIALSVSEGNPDYLGWVERSVRGQTQG